MIKKPTRRSVRVVGGASEQYLRCPECNAREMRTYKQDSTLLFCPRCTYTTPVCEVKRDIVVVPPPESNDPRTYAFQAPRTRTLQKPRTYTRQMLADKGYDIQDYQEIANDEVSP